MYNKKIFYALGIFFFFVFLYSLFLSPPAKFPIGSTFTIEQGSTLRSVSLELEKTEIIRSRILFEAFAILYSGDKHIISSDYYFENKLPVYEIARRISKGEHHIAPISITIPEGFNTAQIADTFALRLPNFDENKFLLETKSLEGYLFPDTYFFLTTDTEQDVRKSMSANFEKKILSLQADILRSNKTQKEIIIMASVIEGEANGDDDRRVISGILWKRLSIGMALQVDVAPETYKTKGLPKSPMNNPGLKAISAAINPLTSPYLYYLHDKEENIHYAKSFSEHRQNVLKYLK